MSREDRLAALRAKAAEAGYDSIEEAVAAARTRGIYERQRDEAEARNSELDATARSAGFDSAEEAIKALASGVDATLRRERRAAWDARDVAQERVRQLERELLACRRERNDARNERDQIVREADAAQEQIRVLRGQVASRGQEVETMRIQRDLAIEPSRQEPEPAEPQFKPGDWVVDGDGVECPVEDEREPDGETEHGAAVYINGRTEFGVIGMTESAEIVFAVDADLLPEIEQRLRTQAEDTRRLLLSTLEEWKREQSNPESSFKVGDDVEWDRPMRGKVTGETLKSGLMRGCLIVRSGGVDHYVHPSDLRRVEGSDGE